MKVMYRWGEKSSEATWIASFSSTAIIILIPSKIPRYHGAVLPKGSFLAFSGFGPFCTMKREKKALRDTSECDPFTPPTDPREKVP